jgi:hypothetical protein
MATPEEQLAFLQQQANAQGISTQNAQMQQAMTNFQEEDEPNLIKWQLDLNSDLEDIQRLLRRDKLEVVKNDDGTVEQIWKAPANEEDQLLNNEGISEVMSILHTYLSRSFILSNFTAGQIDKRMQDFAEAFTDLLFNKYNSYGWANQVPSFDKETGVPAKAPGGQPILDNNGKPLADEKGEPVMIWIPNKEKIKNYRMICQQIIDKVEAAYNRALGGLERDSLTKRSFLHQSDSLNKQLQVPTQKKRSGFFGSLMRP